MQCDCRLLMGQLIPTPRSDDGETQSLAWLLGVLWAPPRQRLTQAAHLITAGAIVRQIRPASLARATIASFAAELKRKDSSSCSFKPPGLAVASLGDENARVVIVMDEKARVWESQNSSLYILLPPYEFLSPTSQYV